MDHISLSETDIALRGLEHNIVMSKLPLPGVGAVSLDQHGEKKEDSTPKKNADDTLSCPRSLQHYKFFCLLSDVEATMDHAQVD